MNSEDEIEYLKSRLGEHEENTHRAAEIGKALLEENIELKSKLDDVVKQYSKKLEALEQDNYSQSLKIEAHRKEKDWFGEELAQTKSDLQSQKTHLLDQFEVEKHQNASSFRKQINDLKADYDQAQGVEKQLKEKIQQLEDLVQQQLEQTQVTSKSFCGDELNELQAELLKLQADNTGLTTQMIDTHADFKLSQEECTRLKNRLKNKDEDLQEVQCHMTSYCNTIEKLRTEIADLSAQLEALRMEANVHNSKGNSIFSEVEDRRVEAEKRLISLRVKSTTLKEKLEMEKQLHQKLKMQMVMLLQMSTGQNDRSSISRLQDQLADARTTIQELMEKVEKYENSENFHDKNVTEIEKNVKEEDKDYTQYLITMLKSKEAEVIQVNKQLRHKNLQHLDVSNKVLTHERSIVDLQQKQDTLRGQNMKFSFKIEELKAKYEPEEINDRKNMTQKKKEKIPLEPNTDDTEPEIKERVNPNLGAFLPSSSSLKENIPAKTNPDLIRDKLSFKKTVSISDDVDVVLASGLVEKQFLSDSVSDFSKIEVKAKVKPKKELKVTQVKAENVNECKNQ